MFPKEKKRTIISVASENNLIYKEINEQIWDQKKNSDLLQ